MSKAARRSHKVEPWGTVGDPPKVGPCRDPLGLWFLEFDRGQERRRKYFGYRHEARAALREFKAGADAGSTARSRT